MNEGETIQKLNAINAKIEQTNTTIANLQQKQTEYQKIISVITEAITDLKNANNTAEDAYDGLTKNYSGGNYKDPFTDATNLQDSILSIITNLTSIAGKLRNTDLPSIAQNLASANATLNSYKMQKQQLINNTGN